MNNRRSDKMLIVVIIFLLLATVIGDKHISNALEQAKREQARYNLEQIRHCLDLGLPVMSEVEVFHQCIGKSKTSATGDVYVFNPYTLEGVYDTSIDIPIGKRMSFTEDSLGRIFSNWDSAVVAINKMILGKDSNYGDNMKYLFDDDWEWLEWIYYPHEASKAFTIGTPYVIVQGTQRDEVFARYKGIRWFVFGSVGFVVLLLLSNLSISHRKRS